MFLIFHVELLEALLLSLAKSIIIIIFIINNNYDSQVLNVNAAKLMAEVHICEPVVTDSLNVLDMDHVNMYLQSQKNAVPLIELCPVYDESGQCDDTALAVEHVRCDLACFNFA